MNWEAIKDITRIHGGDGCLKVSFSHWLKRRNSFVININDVVGVEAVQREPAVVVLIFHTINGASREIDETMVGWAQAVEFVSRSLRPFELDAIESAKGFIGKRFCCFQAEQRKT